jgi:hypothetical protein
MNHIYPIVHLESFSNNLSIISCYFGNSFTYIHPAPSNFKSYFFTNFSGIKDEIEKKGWIYCERKEEISNDVLISSIQSKKIKFLQIMPEYPEIFDGKDIVYIDHKINIKNEHVSHLQNISKNNQTIELILCKHNHLHKKTIMNEIEDAQKQERYRRHMPETIEFINRFLLENNLKDKTPIYLTGILYYHNLDNIKPLLYDINKLCNELQQPECQIFISALAQQYEKYIKSIDFIEINPSLEQAIQ